MKQSLEVVKKRRDEIINILRDGENISNDNLSKMLKTSALTIRRDLQYLEDKGVVKRHYGGAVLTSKAYNFDEADLSEIQKNKLHIAKFAANLILPGDIIFINSSSTALSLLKYVGDKHVVVVTNNGKILSMNLPPNVEVLLTGGQVHGKKQSMVGDFATELVKNISASKCFMGVSGINYKTGISTAVMQETLINKEMMNRTFGSVYVLADSTKINCPNNFSSGDIKKVSYLITDKDIKSDDKNGFEKEGVSVYTV